MSADHFRVWRTIIGCASQLIPVIRLHIPVSVCRSLCFLMEDHKNRSIEHHIGYIGQSCYNVEYFVETYSAIQRGLTNITIMTLSTLNSTSVHRRWNSMINQPPE